MTGGTGEMRSDITGMTYTAEGMTDDARGERTYIEEMRYVYSGKTHDGEELEYDERGKQHDVCGKRHESE